MSSVTPHPRYPRPTVIEALCEIYFQLPEGSKWSAAMTGRLFRRIQDDFPEMEPDQVIGVDVTMGPEGREQRVLRPRLRTRFRHRDRPLLLQLSENIFTINVLAPYPGWQQVRADVREAWSHVLDEIQPTTITRIGLRYINRFPRKTAEERAKDWLIASSYLAPGVLAAAPSSVSRIEARLSELEQLIVALGYQPPDDELLHGAIIFDIDRVTYRTVDVAAETLIASIDILHEEVWQTFDEARAERLEQFLQGYDE